MVDAGVQRNGRILSYCCGKEIVTEKQGWKWWICEARAGGNAGNGCHAKALGRHAWEARSLNVHVYGYSALLAMIRSAAASSIILLILCF